MVSIIQNWDINFHISSQNVVRSYFTSLFSEHKHENGFVWLCQPQISTHFKWEIIERKLAVILWHKCQQVKRTVKVMSAARLMHFFFHFRFCFFRLSQFLIRGIIDFFIWEKCRFTHIFSGWCISSRRLSRRTTFGDFIFPFHSSWRKNYWMLSADKQI